MFTKAQLNEIKRCGKEGWSLRVVASKLGITRQEFMEMYQDNKDAQLYYEAGLSDAEIQLMVVAKSGMEEDQKKFSFVAEQIGLTGSNREKLTPKEAPVKVKKEEKNPMLLNPLSILNLDEDKINIEMNKEKLKRQNAKLNEIDDDDEPISDKF